MKKIRLFVLLYIFLYVATANASIAVYIDADFDGYGDLGSSSSTMPGTVAKYGFSVNNHDFNDSTDAQSPGLIDFVDGIDNNGDAVVDESGINLSDNTFAPVADAGGAYSLTFGNTLILNGEGSFDGNSSIGDDISRYVWNIGGGLPEFVSLGPVLSLTQTDYFSLLNMGENLFTLQVFDRFGSESTLSSSSVNVTSVPIPAAIWLFGSSLMIGFVGVRKK